MPDNDYRMVRMVHPEVYKESGGLSGLAEVPDSAVPQHFRAGWALVAEDWPAPGDDEAAPRLVSLAELQGSSPPAAEEEPGGKDPGEPAGSRATPRGRATGGRGAGQSEETG
jgi:hypothetical protein